MTLLGGPKEGAPVGHEAALAGDGPMGASLARRIEQRDREAEEELARRFHFLIAS